MSSTPGWEGRAMSAGPITSGGCATAFARAGCRRWMGSQGGDPADQGGRRAVRLEAVSVQHQGPAQRAAEGDGDRCVRPRAVDAGHRVALREGRAREAVEDDRLAHLRGATRALRRTAVVTTPEAVLLGVVRREDLPGG